MRDKTVKTCGQCAKYLGSECPRAEYKERELNRVACLPTDSVCYEFEAKDNVKPIKKKRLSQADKLVKLCLLNNPVLFHDQHRTPHARIQQNDVNVTLKIRSRAFKAWIANLLWQHEEKAPGNEGIHGALNVLEAKALFEGNEYHLWNRVAPAADGIWIDKADEKWRAIKVTAEGWEIVDQPPILFKRYNHQLPLTEPKHGGDSCRFLDFINLNEEDDATRLTLLCAVISYLIPTIPHPILVAYGIQGSGKTWLFRLIRKIVDPSVIEVLTLPRNERERVQQLDHHWCAFYDNVTALPSWMSDTLCRAASGSDFSKRELYTDDNDITYSFKRCIGINGINIAAQRGDLLDRSLLIGLQDIPKTRRRTEKELLAEFESYRAEILGGFLDALVQAIREYPSVNPKGLFRMADFTRWGCAITIGLGRPKEDFIHAYEQKVRKQIEEAAYSSPVAMVLMDWVRLTVEIDGSNSNWEGTPSKLFTALAKHAKDELGISTRQKAWPKAPHVLVRQLNELAPSLRALGLEVVTGIRTGKARRIILRSVNSVTSVTKDHKNDDGSDATYTSLHISSGFFKLEDLKSIHWADEFYGEHECSVCGYTRLTSWQAETFKGEKLWICEDCELGWEKKQREVK